MNLKLLRVVAKLSFLHCVLSAGTAMGAATHVVNSPDDASLRAAIASGGRIGFGFSGMVTLTNTIPITTNVLLDGSGVDVTISGGNAVRLFSVAPGVTFGVTNLTLANGTCLVTNLGASADGGAIYNTGGSVTLVRCTLTNNSAQYGNWGGQSRGGAIFSAGGSVALFQSSVSNNLAIAGGPIASYLVTNLAFGGAIYSTNAALTISGCTISSNLCQALVGRYAYGLTVGGAVFQASGSITVEDSLLALNQALGGAGSLDYFAGSPAYGGAVAGMAGNLTLKHSKFIGNTAQGGDGSFMPPGAPGPAFGGAVYSGGSLAATDSSFAANQALAGSGRGDLPNKAAKGYGGAIYNSGMATINGCSVYSNLVQGGAGWGSQLGGTGGDGSGGGVFNAGTAALNGCSIYSNAAQGGAGHGSIAGTGTGGASWGGAIFNAAQLGATNCTLALNSASGGAGSDGDWGPIPPGGAPPLGAGGNAFGGGVFNSPNATFAAMNLTMASNRCGSPSDLVLNTNYGYVYASGYTNGTATGFQIANSGGSLRLHNSVIAYSGTNDNAYGTITDDGYNMSSDGSAQLFGGASYNFTDPKLGPLGDYGGPTLCMPLLAGSPAIDTGDPAQSPGTDQRGFVRPIGARPDMGAYEFGSYQQTPLSLSIGLTASNVTISFPALPSNLYCLQASTNLLNWTDLSTNGPFTCTTNVGQTFSLQGFNSRYLRVRME